MQLLRRYHHGSLHFPGKLIFGVHKFSLLKCKIHKFRLAMDLGIPTAFDAAFAIRSWKVKTHVTLETSTSTASSIMSSKFSKLFHNASNVFTSLINFRMFGAKCFKCCRVISSQDWVRKAKDQVYHLACFACDSCKRQLSTHEEFGIHENRVLCKSHYMETLDGGCTSSDGTKFQF